MPQPSNGCLAPTSGLSLSVLLGDLEMQLLGAGPAGAWHAGACAAASAYKKESHLLCWRESRVETAAAAPPGQGVAYPEASSWHLAGAGGDVPGGGARGPNPAQCLSSIGRVEQSVTSVQGCPHPEQAPMPPRTNGPGIMHPELAGA